MKKFYILGIIAAAVLMVACETVVDEGPHVHSYGDWTVLSAADGLEAVKCTDCGRIRRTRLTGHAYGLTFQSNDDHTAYSVKNCEVDSDRLYIPAYYRPNTETPFLPVTEIGTLTLDEPYGTPFSTAVDITSVYISEGIEIIGNYAFFNCDGIDVLTFPEGLTTIGMGAFDGCSGLTRMLIPPSVTSIGAFAFEGCTNLAVVTIPDTITEIPDRMLSGCASLTSIIIPDSITSIGEYAFSGCSDLTSIVIPPSVTSIGNNAFMRCSSLARINLPAGITLGNYVFYGCSSLTNIPANVTTINDGMFSGCTGLTVITIPASATTIGASAFAGCTNLTNVNIHEGVTTIGASAFINCTGISEFIVHAGITSFGFNNVFAGWTDQQTIFFMGHYSEADTFAAYGNTWYQNSKAVCKYLQKDGITWRDQKGKKTTGPLGK
jgi:hypothetical protein